MRRHPPPPPPNTQQRLPPGERVQPKDIGPVVHKMHNLAQDAEVAAADSAARLRELQGEGADAVAAAASVSHELSLERDTWALLLLLNAVEDEDKNLKAIQQEDAARGNPPQFDPPGPNASDQEVLDRMRSRDPEFRRTEAVVEWLQDAACERLDVSAPAVGVTRGGGAGWSATLESIAGGGGGGGGGGRGHKSEVEEMHPDANLRRVDGAGGEGDAVKVMPLVGQDDVDEEELLRTVWMLVRAGKLRRAKEMCVDRGQPWRAAAMAGGAVVGSRKEGNVEEDGAVFFPGQALWQEMCWQLRYGGGGGGGGGDPKEMVLVLSWWCLLEMNTTTLRALVIRLCRPL